MIILESLIIYGVIAFMAPWVAGGIGVDFGVFFGWQLGSLIQTIFSFREFAKRNAIPNVSLQRKLRLNHLILATITTSIVVFLIVKLIIHTGTLQMDNLPLYCKMAVFIATDAVTLIPMLVYFFVNLLLIYYIKKRCESIGRWAENYIVFLKNAIFLTDIPCLIPYLLVISFATVYRRSIDFGTFVAGAGAMLLLTSNVLSLALRDVLSKIR